MKHFLALLIALLLVPVVAYATPTTLTVVSVSETAAVTANNVADTSVGNRVYNPQGDVFFVLQDAHATLSCTITFAAGTNATVNLKGYGPLTKAALAVALTAGQVKVVGPFPGVAWNDGSGYIQITSAGSGCGTTYINPLVVRSL